MWIANVYNIYINIRHFKSLSQSKNRIESDVLVWGNSSIIYPAKNPFSFWAATFLCVDEYSWVYWIRSGRWYDETRPPPVFHARTQRFTSLQLQSSEVTASLLASTPKTEENLKTALPSLAAPVWKNISSFEVIFCLTTSLLRHFYCWASLIPQHANPLCCTSFVVLAKKNTMHLTGHSLKATIRKMTDLIYGISLRSSLLVLQTK